MTGFGQISDMPRPTDPVIRSLVLQSGLLNAHASGALCWWPRNGCSRRILLDAPATVLLGMGGPQGHIWRFAVGDVDGGVQVLGLPDLRSVVAWRPSECTITALCLEATRERTWRLFSGDAEGEVHRLEMEGPESGTRLHGVGSRITAIRADPHRLTLMCGWQRRTLSRIGERLVAPTRDKPAPVLQTRLQVSRGNSTAVPA